MIYSGNESIEFVMLRMGEPHVRDVFDGPHHLGLWVWLGHAALIGSEGLNGDI